MTIRDSKHFIPVQRIPILSSEDTISDAIDAMKRKSTRLVVIAKGDLKWDLWLDEISQYCVEKGPVTPWMVNLGSIVENIQPTEIIDSAMDQGKAGILLEDERAVMVTEGVELIGVASKDDQALWPPTVSECIQGHIFVPPLPKRCPYDGTMVE